MRNFIVAVLIQRESGGNLTEVLDNLNHPSQERLKLIVKVVVLSSGRRLSVWVLGKLPFALARLMNLIKPKFVPSLWTDSIGIVIDNYMLLLVILHVPVVLDNLLGLSARFLAGTDQNGIATAGFVQSGRKSNWLTTAVNVVSPFAKLAVPSGSCKTVPLRISILNAGIRHRDARRIYFSAKSLLPVLFAGAVFVLLRSATQTAGLEFAMWLMVAALIMVIVGPATIQVIRTILPMIGKGPI